MLAAVGDVTTAVLRGGDVGARLGGEEFILLLPETPRDGAVEVAERFRRALAEVRIAGVDRPITASFGVAGFPGDGIEPTLLLRTADRALYSAKAAGRDRVCVADGATVTAPAADELDRALAIVER